MELEFLNPEETLLEMLENPFVEINYLKAKGAEVMGQACQLAEKENHKEAMDIIEAFLANVEKSSYKNEPKIVKLVKEVNTAKENCKPSNFAKGG